MVQHTLAVQHTRAIYYMLTSHTLVTKKDSQFSKTSHKHYHMILHLKVGHGGGRGGVGSMAEEAVG